MNFDLHSHSTVSDGLLRPAELVRRARANGVDVLALTDHDDVSGLHEAADAARECGIRFVAGVEISVSWGKHNLHVVGLALDFADAQLLGGLRAVRGSRLRRAQRIAEELERVGVEGSLEGALRHAGAPDGVGRTHFARFLVERNYARDVRAVFRHFLASGKPGYVPHQWAALGEAVSWITGSGGLAVIAHPGRYGLAAAEQRQLFEEFKGCGGAAVEVVTPGHSAEQTSRFARLALEMDLAASRGSDFHGAGEGRLDIGRVPDLPAGVKPIWSLL